MGVLISNLIEDIKGKLNPVSDIIMIILYFLCHLAFFLAMSLIYYYVGNKLNSIGYRFHEEVAPRGISKFSAILWPQFKKYGGDKHLYTKWVDGGYEELEVDSKIIFLCIVGYLNDYKKTWKDIPLTSRIEILKSKLPVDFIENNYSMNFATK